jgi:hypothetical protein
MPLCFRRRRQTSRKSTNPRRTMAPTAAPMIAASGKGLPLTGLDDRFGVSDGWSLTATDAVVLTIVLDGTCEEDVVGIGNFTKETSDVWNDDAVGVVDPFVDVGASIDRVSSSWAISGDRVNLLRPGVRSFSSGQPPPGKHGSIVQQPENPPRSTAHLYQVPPSGQVPSCLRISKVMLVVSSELRWEKFMTSLEGDEGETAALQLLKPYTCLAVRLQQTRRPWLWHCHLKQLARSRTMHRGPQGVPFVWL